MSAPASSSAGPNQVPELGKRDEAIEQVITVGAPTDDAERQIDLRRRQPADRLHEGSCSAAAVDRPGMLGGGRAFELCFDRLGEIGLGVQR